eukprot:TRINITY_DN25973_c0_g1_i1.p1 TRINITY_DN25973_c0_g1~~TRINITY_DN25973_c0_g1_i1.p1  ORF type:complete len:431 (+),score=66.43 TRINITY_DN25973_c0_g1_i1:34-1326(+)
MPAMPSFGTAVLLALVWMRIGASPTTCPEDGPAAPSSALMQLGASSGLGSEKAPLSFMERAKHKVAMLQAASQRLWSDPDTSGGLIFFLLFVFVLIATLVAASFSLAVPKAEPSQQRPAMPERSSLRLDLPPRERERADSPMQRPSSYRAPSPCNAAMAAPRTPESNRLPSFSGRTRPFGSTSGAPTSGLPPPGPPPPSRPWCMDTTACPMLVVPEGQDSVLAVPIMPGPKISGKVSLDIADQDGMPVLKVDIFRPTPGGASGVFSFSGNTASAQRLSTVSMRSSPGGQEEAAIALKMPQIEPRQTMLKNRGRPDDSGILTLGFLSKGAQGQPVVDICAADGAVYAKLEKVGRTFRLQVGERAETKMVFLGKIEDQQVHIENENGKTVAETEPCSIHVEPGNRFMRVTIKSKVDAGVVLVALVAIEERFV